MSDKVLPSRVFCPGCFLSTGVMSGRGHVRHPNDQPTCHDALTHPPALAAVLVISLSWRGGCVAPGAQSGSQTGTTMTA